MQRYNPTEIEAKWQNSWLKNNIYQAIDFDERKKYVMLTEFPYPSGDGLHLGHIREYTYGDIIARYKRMRGYNVLFPMGYDAFGLPTENYAIKNKLSPQQATDKNIANFQNQLMAMGYSIDWTRAFRTSDPNYYKWTQWLFLQFFKQGLAYQDEIAINWCPECKTGLANEEVVNGRHERCNCLVEKKILKQWLLKITDYADKLINGLKNVDYPFAISEQQINWIGKSEGLEIDFALVGSSQKVTVFTTRPDTIYGVTFLVLAPENKLVDVLTKESHRDKVKAYLKSVEAKTEIERQSEDKTKTGVYTGTQAIHPITKERLPIWVADYVLSGYGTGAIMAVAAHDERDWQFAKKYNLKIKFVIKKESQSVYQGAGKLINSSNFNGLNNESAKKQISNYLIDKRLARSKVRYKLRDWIFSRQHYWGEPIPIIHCPADGAVAVDDADLPVKLPQLSHFQPSESGSSPLADIENWVNVKCPKCGQPAKRETDTMPNWAGSSWYYLRYYDPHNDQAFASKDKLNYWGMVDFYLGGMEHTTLHLLYSRFWHQFLFDQKLVPFNEPYAKRRGQGIILAADGSKMSKSKGNVINPNEILDSGYGADALRLALAFLAPYDQTTRWNPETVAGTYRFLQRLWTLSHEYLITSGGQNDSQYLTKHTNQLIMKVSQDLDSLNFNTAIALMMDFVNKLYKFKVKDEFKSKQWPWSLQCLLKLLAPYAPHITEELFHKFDNQQSIHLSDWPVYDVLNTQEDKVKIIIQINGKVRDILSSKTGTSKKTIEKLAKERTKIKPFLDKQEIITVIYVPDKVINFVLK